jgi:hypothetical protein
MPAIIVIVGARELWPFSAALIVGMLLIGTWYWMGWIEDRIATVREASTGFTAALTFFAAYSAEIDRRTQGGALILMAVPLALVALGSSTRLRRALRYQVQDEDNRRQELEARRHSELMAAALKAPAQETRKRRWFRW